MKHLLFNKLMCRKIYGRKTCLFGNFVSFFYIDCMEKIKESYKFCMNIEIFIVKNKEIEVKT